MHTHTQVQNRCTWHLALKISRFFSCVFNIQTVFHANTWWCRKIFCCLGLLLLIYRASQYKDYNQINHRILLQIQTHIQQQKITSASNNNPYMLTQGLIQSSSSAALSIASPLKVPAIQDRVGQTISMQLVCFVFISFMYPMDYALLWLISL